MGTLLRSLHWPRLFAAVAAAAVILGTVSAAGPLFLSSAANAVLDDELALVGNVNAGLTANLYGFIDRERFDTFQEHLYEAITPIRELRDPIATILGTAVGVSKKGSDDEVRMRLAYRDGALQHVEVVERGGPSNGVWMTHDFARLLGIQPGDEVVLAFGDRRASTRIAGIYQALASRPLASYWRPLEFKIVNPRSNDLTPPPFLIASKDTIFELEGGTSGEADMLWHFSLRQHDLDYEQAKRLESRYKVVHFGADDPLTPLGKAVRDLRVYTFVTLSVDSLLFSTMDRIRATIASLDSSVRIIWYAGQAVALFAIAGAGTFIARRRASEVRLMLAQGLSPTRIGARVSLEGILPIAIGLAAGTFVAWGLIGWVGPGAAVDVGLNRSTLIGAALTGVVACVVMGVAVVIAARRELELGSARVRRALARTPWEVAVLMLAAAAFYEIRSGRDAVIATLGEPQQIDVLVLAFPLLLITGLVGLGVRLLRRGLPRLRTSGRRAPVALFLPLRRLADSSSTALLLVSLAAVATGVLVYASTLVASLEATINAKAHVAVGSDIAVSMTQQRETPDAPFPITRVTRTRANLFPGDIQSQLLAIDTETFEDTAYWEDGFSSTSLGGLIERLRHEGERLPVIVAGLDASREMTLNAAELDIPVEVIDEPVAFPGMVRHTPVVVVDRDLFRARAEDAGRVGLAEAVESHELWGRGDPSEVMSYFEEEGLALGSTSDVREYLGSGGLRSVSWTFSLMLALGALTALIVVLALLLYLEARQRDREISYGLARRMGLRAADHRMALAIEIFGMLAIAVALGAVVAAIGSRVVLAYIDPLPDLSPPGLFRLPMAVVLGLVPAAVVIAVFGAWRVQRSADRVRMAEVMRVAG